MIAPHSGLTWFDDDDWIGREIVFQSPVLSRWIFIQKIAEHEYCVVEFEVKKMGMESSCRGVFVCSSLDHPGKEAVVKIRMQIPYYNTAHSHSSKRALQAQPEVPRKTVEEVEGLQRLTTAGCSSTPSLYAWKHETRGHDGYVPGGYIDYILMERVPGSTPLFSFAPSGREEREEIRKALKTAWLECTACGLTHGDPALRNIVWDRENQKCYIVDWEEWYASKLEDVWRDTRYVDWNLAWVRSRNYENMSTWEL